jgi:hypothetical protein
MVLPVLGFFFLDIDQEGNQGGLPVIQVNDIEFLWSVFQVVHNGLLKKEKPIKIIGVFPGRVTVYKFSGKKQILDHENQKKIFADLPSV